MTDVWQPICPNCGSPNIRVRVVKARFQAFCHQCWVAGPAVECDRSFYNFGNCKAVAMAEWRELFGERGVK